MSSVQSGLRQQKTNVTKIFTPNLPCYDDGDVPFDNTLPVPFTLDAQGVLDIKIQDNVVQDLLTVGQFNGTTYGQPDYQCKLLGGYKTAESLGPNMILYIKALVADIEEGTAPSKIELLIKPQMVKVQFSMGDGNWPDEDTIVVSDLPPSSDGYVTGAEANNFRTVWTFATPMTIKYYSNDYSRTRYLNFTAAMDSI